MPARPENLTVSGPAPAAPAALPIDPTVKWSLTTPFGIQIGPPQETNAFAGPWLSGHLNDVLLVPNASGQNPVLLAGADSGGVWNVGPAISVIPTNFDPNSPNPPSPTSQCLSNDWDVPGVVCLCAGPGAQHVYAGTSDVLNGRNSGFLYETVATQGVFDVLTWRVVPDASGQIKDFTAINRIVVLNGSPNRIVLATDIGVFWAVIPASGGNYAWQQVTKMANGAAFPAGAYAGLALGPSGSVIAAAFGVDTATGLFGIFYGDFTTGSLVMTRATVPSSGPQNLLTFDQKMYRTTVTAAPGNPKVLYAIASSIGDAMQSSFARPTEAIAGLNRTIPPVLIPPRPPVLFRMEDRCSPTLASKAATIRRWLFRPSTMVSSPSVGRAELTCPSTAAPPGAPLAGPGLHADVHGLYFDPSDKTGNTLYICSDGGLVVTRDLGKTFDSDFNQCLATLQLYSTTSLRDFYGTMSVAMPLVAAGTQDNGNVICAVEAHYTAGVGLPQPTPGPWVQITGCDGGPVAFLATAPVPRFFPVNPAPFRQAAQIITGNICGVGQPLQSQSVQPSFMWNHDTPITPPVRASGQPDNKSGLAVAIEGLRAAPKIKNTAGQLMYAIAAGGSSNVWGLFANADGSDPNFELLAVIQSPVQGDTVRAMGSLDRTTVFAGTKSGRMFKFKPTPGTLATAQSVIVNLPPGVPQGAVERIVVLSDSLAYATYNFGWSGRVLKFSGTSWAVADSGLPGNVYFGLESDDTGGQLFAANADRVFVTRNGGTNWLNCSTGFPKQPHCSDLRFGRDSNGTGWLFCSTFGRSMWQALVDAAPRP